MKCKSSSASRRLLAGISASFFFASSAVAQSSLVAEWSDTHNPSGPWSYRFGTAILPGTAAWNPSEFGPGQPAWAPGSSTPPFVPAWFKSNGSENFVHDWLPGDVVVRTDDTPNGGTNLPSNVVWTSPGDGVVRVSGSLWLGRDVGQSLTWQLTHSAGTMHLSGSLSSGDQFDRAHPRSVGPHQLLVHAGEQIELRLITSSNAGEYVGVTLNVDDVELLEGGGSFCSGSVPLPDVQVRVAPMVFGFPLGTYQWRRGGVPISDGVTPFGSTVVGATTTTITIQSPHADDSGAYDVEFTPEGGGPTRVIGPAQWVGVGPLPTSTRRTMWVPYGDQGLCGCDGVIHAPFADSTALTYRWTVAGEPLATTLEPFLVFRNYIFEEGEEGLAATFSCNEGLFGVANDIGLFAPYLLYLEPGYPTIISVATGATSGQCHESGFVGYVSLNSPPQFVELASPPPVSCGTVPTLTATVANAFINDTRLTVQWRKNGVSIADGPTGTGSVRTSDILLSGPPEVNAGLAYLFISNPGIADVGTYDVVITDPCHSTTSNTVVLNTNVCPADLDNDGVVSNGHACDGGIDINDLLYFLGAFELGSLGSDLDNGSSTGTPDGGVDVSDLLFFLAHFEAGC